jgi:hypothetical protein
MARSVAFSIPLYRYGAPLWRQGGAYRTRCGNPGTAMGMEEFAERACLVCYDALVRNHQPTSSWPA